MDVHSTSLVFDWNHDDVRLPYRPPQPDETVAHTFEQLARKHPNRVALVTEDNSELTYGQVNERANAMVRCLTLHAARSESGDVHPGVVLVALPRSTALPIALLAVVKSGLTYWGVDMILQSSSVVRRSMNVLGCRLVVVDESMHELLFDELGVPAGVVVVVVNGLGEVVSLRGEKSQSGLTTSTFQCPRQAMYVEFTSGSTGQPKAVAVPHRAVLGYVKNCASIFCWDSATRSMLYHSVSFDLHVHDLWGPWLHGGCVIVIPVPIADVNGVWQRGVESKATHLSMTPFGFSMFTTVHKKRRSGNEYEQLKSVMLCGEALDFQSVSSWVAKDGPIPSIMNCYGITETTVINTFLEVTPERLRWPSSIGRRLPHTLLLLLDENRELVAHGERGELYLAGDCLASGYITSIEKNDASFVPIPENLLGALQVVAPSMSLKLMYKSGDLASFHEDYNGFLYRGRADAEIKSAGFRVHPLEVEECLAQLQSVREAVVVAASHPDGRKALFAFIRRRNSDVNKAVVLTELRRSIADYKIPTMLFLEDDDVIPLSSTNKVERKLLSQWATDFLALPQGAARPKLPS